MILQLGRNMKVNTEQFAALIFDLDGTLIDSMPLHNEAWIKTLRSHGHVLDERILYELAGIPTFETVNILNKRFSWNLDPATVTHQKESYYLSHLEEVKPNKDVVQIAKEHFRLKPMAIVTGGLRDKVKRVLESLNLNHLFDIIVCSEDTLSAKPSPEPFLFAASKLKQDPLECLVFEDGEAGMIGAKAAGMSVVKIIPSQFK